MTRGRALVAILLVTVLLTLGFSSVASADGSGLLLDVPGDPAGWTTTPTVSVLHSGVLGPGQFASGVIGVRNAGPAPGVLTLHLADVEGRLAGKLHYSMSLPGSTSPGWSGSLDSLEDSVVVAPSFAAGSTVEPVFAVSLGDDVDNRWSDATAAFQMVWTLSGTALAAGGGSSRATVAGAGSPARNPGGGILAFTGAAVWPSSVAAALLFAAGGILTLAGRRRRAEDHSSG